MSRTLTIRRSLPCPPQRLMRLLSDLEFLAARHRAQGAVAVTVRQLSSAGGLLVQEARIEEPAHTMRGIDPQRLESSVTTYVWEPAALRGTWSYHGPHGQMLRLAGTFVIQADGEGSSFRADFEVSASVPLIGGLIESRIIEEIESAQPRIDALVADRLRRG